MGYTFYEASELLGTKEMTAREFAEWIADMSNCVGRHCAECVLNECDKMLCNARNWKGNIDKLFKIVKSERFTKKAISTIENFIENPDCLVVNDEFVESLKFVVEKLKEG